METKRHRIRSEEAETPLSEENMLLFVLLLTWKHTLYNT